MAIFPGSAIPSAVSDYEIDNSLRFNRDDAAYLAKTFSVDGNRKKWTISTWVKITDTSTNQNPIVGVAPDANNAFTLAFQPHLDFYNYVSASGYVWRKQSSAVYRDVGAWMHVVAVLDTDNGTAEDRARLYVNGERITAWDTDSDPSSGYAATWWNDASYEHRIGNEASSASFKNGNYLAEFYCIDGSALGPDSFGSLDSDTNMWKPLDSDDVKDAVNFGVNGFYQRYNQTGLAASFADDSGGYLVPSGVTEVEVLVVAGGGGGSGGGNGGAGGGAGGLVYISNYAVTPGERISVTVGDGGAAVVTGNSGNDGANSVFNNITAIGGGGGGNAAAGRNGGSGGGGWQTGNTAGGSSTQTTTNDGYTSTGWGNAGGQGGSGAPYQGGGGGGAGAVGVAGKGSGGISSIPTGGNGGIGKAYTIADGSTSVYYSGGGGGGVVESGSSSTDTGQGGSGGGGRGGYNSSGSYVEPVAGTANTGGGGGGGRNDGAGAAGGSGVVIVYDGTTRTTFTSSNEPHTITANGNATNQRPQHHNVTANGDAHLIGPKVGTSVISMDGTGDSIYAASSSDFNFGTGDFTLEAWMNNNGSGNEAIFAHFTSGTDKWYFIADYGNGSIAIYDRVSGLDAESKRGGSNGASLTNGAWHHVAAVRSSGVVKFYIDGKGQDNQVTPTLPAANFGKTATCYIGEDGQGSDYWKGYFGPLRISNSARYTADFDVPTTCLD